ncbi:MAG TPA: putative 4-hydroxybenzoate polyprenyltransferase [Candidatus Megamonas gallistercoris]|nr:putative 4-hydroxybenzoate polyprenyltransferase [Candidatus Megamonas gallistercoris]
MSKLTAHINNIALHHTVFALPFAYMGLFLAARGIPSFHDFLWVTLAMVGARSSALAMDNIVDLKFDKIQPRMKKRPLVTGAIKPIEVVALIIVSLGLFLFSAAQLAPICLKLTPICLFFLLFYPYTKRFTFLCHYFLGMALAMAPAGGYMAVTGQLPLGIIFLSGGVCLWIGSFDVIYGSQDRQFDLKNGLHSMATRFGVAKAQRIAAYVHIISIICFILTGIYFDLSWIYYIGVLIAVITLIYQHSLISPYDFHRLTQVYFMRNGIVSIVIFIFTLIDLI